MINFTRLSFRFFMFFAIMAVAIAAKAQPAAPTVSGSLYVCSGSNTTLTASGATGATFSWYSDAAGINIISTAATYTTPTLSSSTNYYVLQNVGGVNSALYTVQVIVNNPPAVSAGNNVLTCPGNSVTLTATGADTYSWQPVGLSGASISIAPITTTTYTVTGTATATGCSNTSQVTVTVASVSTQAAQAVCAGQQATLNASGADNYTWQPGSLTGSSITVTPSITTIYTVTGQDNAGCSTTASQTVTVNALPNVGAGSAVIISGGTSSTLTGSGADIYAWSDGDNTASTTVTPPVTTTYTVTGTIAATGCNNTASVTVTVVTTPFITGNLNVCSGSSTALTGSGITGATFAWYSDAAGTNLLSSSAGYTTPNLTTPTNYYVQQTYGGVAGPIYDVEVFVAPIPATTTPTSLLATPATICQGQSSNLSATVDAASGQYLYWYDSLGNLLAGSASGGNFTVSPTGTTTYYAQSQVLIDTATFNFTGGVQTFTVPAGVTSIQVDARGARGGDNYDCSAYGGSVQGNPGLGGRVQATLNVTPGEVLSIFVGQHGSAGYSCSGYSGGYNGGGGGPDGNGGENAGGGGGGTDIRVNGQALTNRVLVAGGGGGDAYLPGISGPTGGGSGGGLTGGAAPAAAPGQSAGGGGGSQTAGGSAGYFTGAGGTSTGTAGSLGFGGNAGQFEGDWGGGGGGGYYGGGSSSEGSGGGGGSSYTDPVLCQNVAHTQGYQNGDGQLVITYNTAANCAATARQPLTVVVDTTPNVSAGQNVTTCVGTGVTLTATGTDSYSWQPGGLAGASVFVTPTATTTYTVTGTKANGGCTNTSQVTVTVTSTSASAIQTICAGQPATLNASGASNYTWQPGGLTGSSVSVSPSVTTIYTVTGSNPSGCSTVANDTVTVKQLPVVSAGSNVTVSAGGSVTLTATGADTYNWSSPYNYNGASITFTPSSTSTWQVTGTSATTGCYNIASAVVTVTPVTAVTGNTVVCPGSTTTLTASGTAPFTWYSSSSSSTVLYTGATFTTPAINTDTTFWVADNGGTRVPVSITTAQSQYQAAATPYNICPGGSSSLTIAGFDQTVNWYDAASGGNLLGTVTGGSAFSVTPAATTVYYAQLQANSQADTATFNFTGGVQTFTVPAGVTSIQVDARGARGGDNYDCSAYGGGVQGNPGLGGRVQATLNVTPGEVLSIFVGQHGSAGYSCSGYSGGYNGGGGGPDGNGGENAGGGGGGTDIRVNGQALTDRVLVAGGGGGYAYLPGISGPTGGGSGGGLTGGAAPAAAPGQSAGGGGGSQTAGGSAGYFTGAGGTSTGTAGSLGFGGNAGQFEGDWGGGGGGGYYGGGSSSEGSGGGGGSSYTDPVLCQNVAHTQGYQNGDGQLIIVYNAAQACNTTFTISDTVVVSKTLTLAATAICSGSNDSLFATGATTYTWQPGNLTGSSVSVSPVNTTIYTVIGYNAIGNCSTTAYDTVNAKPLPVLALTADTAIAAGTSAVLTVSGADSYLWNPGALNTASITVTPAATTTYTVTGISNATGCSDSGHVVVTVAYTPTVTGVTGICPGANTTLTASGTAPFNWYTTATGGTPVYTGASFTTPAINTNTSYWVAGSASTRLQVNITVNPYTVVPPPAICAGTSTALTITGATQTVNWYDASNGGNLLGSVNGAAPFTVSPTSTAIYYAQTQYYLPSGQTATQTFNYSGGVQQFTVPAGVTSIKVDASGGRGGYDNEAAQQEPVGLGGRVQAAMQVTPGQVLYIYVGQRGYGNFTNGRAGINSAFNGGGYVDNTHYYVGGGGGATDIRTGGQNLTNRVLVAGGGGGGAGENASGYGAGGAGGGTTGAQAAYSIFYYYGGYGGTQSAGGSGGSYKVGSIFSGTTYYGNAGSLGIGGAGALGNNSSNRQYYGAGGGGGYYGGGGATEFGGGGGGSSYTDATLCTNVTHTQGYNNGDGQLTITYNTVNTCNVTMPDTVKVNPLPVIAIHASANPTELYAPVTLTASGASTYVWTNGVQNGVSFIADSSATYRVSGTDSNGCVDTASVYLQAVPALYTTSFAPSSAASGTTVNIYGKNFISITGVSFGGVAAASFTVVSDSVITATVGSGTSGTVTVTNAFGADSLPGFTYIINVSACKCNCAAATLTAQGSGTITWYDAASSGNLLYTGSEYLTPVLTADTTYWYSVNGSSARVKVSITLTNNGPTNVIASPYSINAGSSSNLSANVISGNVYWYTTAVGGTAIGSSASGANFAVSPSDTTTYYASADSTVSQQGNTTFSYTGGVQTFTVPANVTSISIDASGAQGGASIEAGGGLAGGAGGRVQGTMAVTPGQVLYVYVGQRGYGGDCSGCATSGWNGGGTTSNIYNPAGFGGGATDVRAGGQALANRVLVAAGGGGAGKGVSNCSIGGGVGGAGGGLTGTAGTAFGTCPSGGINLTVNFGGGGTQSAGGKAGSVSGHSGTAGSLGAGGNSAAANGNWGGGGGGGYYGGGSATEFGGAGGGSSYTNGTYLSGVTLTSGYNSGNGSIIISYIVKCSGGRVPVTINVIHNPVITGDTVLCPSNATTLTANGAAPFNWYTSAAGGTPVYTGATFATPVLDANTSYWVTDSVGNKVQVNITITPNWTGTVDNNWNNAANWCSGAVPTAADNVVIGAGTPYSPTISTAAVANSVTIATGATITVNSAGTLTASGNITNNGTFNGLAGSLVLNGTVAQTITGGIVVNNFTVNNPTGVNISSGTTKVYGTYTPTAGTLTTNGNLLLASNANGTASVAQSSVSNYVTGNVTVERYIPAHRAWRMLTAPLSNTGTIYANWQNNGVADDSTGANIWKPGGTGGSGNGFTAGGGAASIESYDPVANNWVGLSNTTSTLLSGTGASAANTGIGLFVTGPFGSDNIVPSTGATVTTLRATGNLQTGTQQFVNSGLTAGTFMLVGNPYASPLAFTHIGATGAASGNIYNTMWAWDAQRSGTSYGGYVTFSWDATSGSYDQDIDASQTAQTMAVQSGEAFFVQAVNNGTATVTINETDKAPTSAITGGVFGLQPAATPAQQLRITLSRGAELVDGVMAKFGDLYKTGVSDDVDKLFDYDENLSLRIDTNYLAIERRPVPSAADTIFLDAYAMKKSTAYSFTVNPQNMPTGLQAWLVDAYTNTKAPLSMAGGTTVSFNTGTDAGSLSETRFAIVFQTNGVLAAATTLKAVAAGTDVQVGWTTPNELGVKQYQLQRSADAQHFITVNTAMARNTGTKEVYDYTDAQPQAGDNYYRVEIFNSDGTITYSNVVLVKMASGAASFSIFPNPTARNRQVHVQFTNMAAGRYALVLFSTSGKQLMDETITLDGTTTMQTISLPQGIAGGSYRVVLLDGNGGEWKQQLIVQ